MSATADRKQRVPAKMSEHRPLRTIATFVFYGVLALAPLPFGSVDPSAIAFWCILLGICAALLGASSDRLRRPHVLLLGGIGVIVCLYAFVLYRQLAPISAGSGADPIWTEAAKALGTSIAPSVSLVKGEPLFALGAPLCNVLALICGLLVGTDRARANQCLKVIAWSGAIYALYGLLSFLFEPNVLLWRDKRAYLGSLTGTFVNRNSAAAYFGSCAVIWLLLLLEHLRKHLGSKGLKLRVVAAALSTQMPRTIVTSFSALVGCIIALFLTGSRAGVVLSLFSLVIAFTVFMRRSLPPRTGVWIALACSTAVVLLVLQIFGGAVSNRFDIQGLADEGRFETYRSVLRMIAGHPWFGTGLGTFQWAFPAYRSADVSMWGVWDLAHSTPLELAAELGLPLAAVVALGWGMMFGVLIRGIRVRVRTIAPLAAFAVALIAVLHSCIDFSLQIPGFAMVVFGLLGAGLAQSFGRNERHPISSGSGGDSQFRAVTHRTDNSH